MCMLFMITELPTRQLLTEYKNSLLMAVYLHCWAFFLNGNFLPNSDLVDDAPLMHVNLWQA